MKQEEKKIETLIWFGINILAPLIPIIIATLTKYLLEDKISIIWITGNILLFIFSFSISTLSLMYNSIKIKRTVQKYGVGLFAWSLSIMAISLYTVFDSQQVNIGDAFWVVFASSIIFLTVEIILAISYQSEIFDLTHQINKGEEDA